MRNSCAGLFEGSSSMSMPIFVQIKWTGLICCAEMWFCWCFFTIFRGQNMPLSKWPGWDPLPEAQPSKNYFFVISTPCCIISDGSRIFLFLTPPPYFYSALFDSRVNMSSSKLFFFFFWLTWLDYWLSNSVVARTSICQDNFFLWFLSEILALSRDHGYNHCSKSQIPLGGVYTEK